MSYLDENKTPMRICGRTQLYAKKETCVYKLSSCLFIHLFISDCTLIPNSQGHFFFQMSKEGEYYPNRVLEVLIKSSSPSSDLNNWPLRCVCLLICCFFTKYKIFCEQYVCVLLYKFIQKLITYFKNVP